jgi:hypothetical protein
MSSLDQHDAEFLSRYHIIEFIIIVFIGIDVAFGFMEVSDLFGIFSARPTALQPSVSFSTRLHALHIDGYVPYVQKGVFLFQIIGILHEHLA